MMKALWIISFVLLYISFNTGMLIKCHFCYETFDHLTVFIEPGNCCEDNCPGCHNSSYELKISDDYDNQVMFSFDEIYVLSIIQQCLGFSALLPLQMGQETIAIDTGPLITTANPIYLTNRALLI